MNPIWSWVLAIVAIIGFMTAQSRSQTVGFAVLALNQVIWIIYATRTAQYGFYLTATFNLLAFGIAWAKQVASPDE